MLKVYGDVFSGNCFKVKLALLQLDLPHEWVNTDLLGGATHTPEFLAMNPNARVLQWQFFEQYSHEPYIAVARFIVRYLKNPAEQAERLQRCFAPGYRALEVMETHLARRTFFVAERYSIADIALYAYTHVAHEGGFDLGRYGALRAWLERVREQPAYRSMDDAAF